MTDQVSRRPSVATGALCAGLFLVACASTVRASVDLNPMARVSYDHNSNVLDRPPDLPPFASSGNTELGDTILRYLAGGTADFNWGLDHLALSGQGERFEYKRFDSLNHYETHFSGVFDWYLGPRLSGSFDYIQKHIMAPLADTLSDQLEIQNDKTASATFRYLLTPRWRIDLQPAWHQFDSPLPGFPDFGDVETSLVGSLNYLGIEKLTAGLRLEYVDGRFHGIVDPVRYHQTTAQLTANYAVSGFSSFDAQLGYTKRQNRSAGGEIEAQGLGDTNAFTGSLGIHRTFSVKTSATLRVFRDVQNYVAGANSQVGTGGEASVEWKPDVKFLFAARYRMTTESIQGALAIANNFQNRADHVRAAELDIEYHAFRWLTLKPYYVRNLRHSNFDEANFSSTLIGIDATAFLNGKQPNLN